jgi:hypothetical protein
LGALDETLPFLAEAAPRLGRQLEELLHESDEVQRHAEELLQAVHRHRAEGGPLFDEVRQVLAGLETEASADQGTLHEAGGQVDAAVDGAAAELDKAQQDVSQANDAALEAIRGLERELSAAGEAAREAQAEIQGAMAQLGGALKTGVDELHAAEQAARTEAEALQHAVEEAQDTVQSSLRILRDRMTFFLDQGRARLERTAKMIEQLDIDHEEAIVAAGSMVEIDRRELELEVKARLDTDVQGRAQAAVQDAVGGLVGLARGLAELKASVVAQRDGLDGQFETLRQAMAPLPAAIESVKQAAGEVGMAW